MEAKPLNPPCLTLQIKRDNADPQQTFGGHKTGKTVDYSFGSRPADGN